MKALITLLFPLACVAYGQSEHAKNANLSKEERENGNWHIDMDDYEKYKVMGDQENDTDCNSAGHCASSCCLKNVCV